MSFFKKEICLLSVLWLLLCPLGVFAQFFNNGSQVTVGNNGILYTQGDLINKDSSIYNKGRVVVKGNCIVNNRETSRIVNFNGDSLFVYGDFKDSSLYGQNTGVVSLNGTAQNIASTSHILANLVIGGGGNKTLLSNVYVRFNLNLQNGFVTPGAFVFGMDSTGSISPATVTSNSFIVGNFSRKRKTGAEDSLFFPIGNTTAQFRPATLLGIASVSGKFPVYTLGTTLGTPKAGTEVSTVYSRIWGVASTDTTVAVSNIKLYYQASDVSSTLPSNLVVAQSNNATGNYNSIGEKGGTATYVVSEFKPTKTYYTLGASNKLYGNFKVFLEGPYGSGPAMTSALASGSVLQDSLLGMYPMATGYAAPLAVDRVTFVLQDISTKAYVDTAYAWIMPDGHILDYSSATKSYVTFAKALANTQYYVLVNHRNHLPAASTSVKMSTTAFASGSSAYTYDFSKGVYGTGAKYDAVNGNWLLYAADNYKSTKNQTDIVDLTQVGLDDNAATYRQSGKHYYHATDLNLDGQVNSSDYQIANDHNGKLYYSTLP